ncbi:hypothetical protein Salat_2497900 [Sesamum alatum]|uniref:Uncharacterized protein n=1 Tax=Sesamum alatum TaxID=300844 RepID=A0AAE1XRJ6_9LAMI|nr:hypothetical protein Salat_2497900 [Sesamum alatum]
MVLCLLFKDAAICGRLWNARHDPRWLLSLIHQHHWALNPSTSSPPPLTPIQLDPPAPEEHMPKPPKLLLPSFDGSDALEWHFKLTSFLTFIRFRSNNVSSGFFVTLRKMR